MFQRFLRFIFGMFVGGCALSFSYALVVEIPPQGGQPDVVVTGPTQIQADEGTLFDTIKLINKYLRSAIGVVCMGVLIYGGISLITAQGDEVKMKKTSKLLMGALIGILIAILSYAIIRIVVNLFSS